MVVRLFCNVLRRPGNQAKTQPLISATLAHLCFSSSRSFAPIIRDENIV